MTKRLMWGESESGGGEAEGGGFEGDGGGGIGGFEDQ